MNDRLQENKNKFEELIEQLEYLKGEEKTDQQAIQRAESKLKSVASVLDTSQARKKTKRNRNSPRCSREIAVYLISFSLSFFAFQGLEPGETFEVV